MLLRVYSASWLAINPKPHIYLASKLRVFVASADSYTYCYKLSGLRLSRPRPCNQDG
ncbi:hypothetical protein EMIT0373P_20494 [Pseudomonas chlororaphis]